MKILVIEDDSFLLNAYRLKLTKLGHDIKMAMNGEEAKKVMEEWLPQAIVLDLMMPTMDGYDFLSEIRKIDRFKKVPVLVASNLGQPEDVERAMKLGADGYVIKENLSLSQLVEKLDELINKK